jgi:hypothetical protein
MELELTPMPLCHKCDNRSITVGDGGRPLCSRHEWLVVNAQRNLADKSESSNGAGREPAATPSDSDVGVVDAVMESIERSLESAEDALLDVEAVAARLRPSHETAVDLVFTLNNMLLDIDEAWSTTPKLVDQPPRLGNELIEVILGSVSPQPTTAHTSAIRPVPMRETTAA